MNNNDNQNCQDKLKKVNQQEGEDKLKQLKKKIKTAIKTNQRLFCCPDFNYSQSKEEEEEFISTLRKCAKSFNLSVRKVKERWPAVSICHLEENKILTEDEERKENLKRKLLCISKQKLITKAVKLDEENRKLKLDNEKLLNENKELIIKTVVN